MALPNWPKRYSRRDQRESEPLNTQADHIDVVVGQEFDAGTARLLKKPLIALRSELKSDEDLRHVALEAPLLTGGAALVAVSTERLIYIRKPFLRPTRIQSIPFNEIRDVSAKYGAHDLVTVVLTLQDWRKWKLHFTKHAGRRDAVIYVLETETRAARTRARSRAIPDLKTNDASS